MVEGKILAAVIGAAHGTRGEVKLSLKLQDVTFIKDLGVLFAKNGTPFSIASWREASKGTLVKFEHIADRTQAESFKGTHLFLPEKNRPPLEDGEVYYADLKGLKVLDEAGQNVGLVADVFSNGIQDILVIQTSSNEVLVPYTDDAVASVDLENKTIQLTAFAQEFFTL